MRSLIKKEKDNVMDDALSHTPEAAICTLSRPIWEGVKNIHQEVLQDTGLAKFLEANDKGKPTGYQMIDGKLHYKGKWRLHVNLIGPRR